MIRSKVLDLDVRAEGDLLRFWDPATRRDVWHHSEAVAVVGQAKVRADRARAQQEAARADREAAARLDAEARASRDAAAGSAAEARIAELEAALQRPARESE